MSFTRSSLDPSPIVDTVFTVAKQAKEDILKNGEENVINATIGSLYDEDGQLVALKSVFNHYDALSHQIKASYAMSFKGNVTYCEQVWNWLLQGRSLNLAHSTIATPGGSGAISSAFLNFLNPNETVVIPEIAWAVYKMMADQYCLNVEKYNLFNQDQFNLESFKTICRKVLHKQKKLLVVINDPCHNPTGYSMSLEEWNHVIEFLNELSKEGPCILLNDIAYLDYGFDCDHTRDYLSALNCLEENVLVLIAFSTSKTCTSYGLRCGAAILIAKDFNKLKQTENLFEKTARAVWSNIPNAAMENFTWVTTENKAAFMQEKQSYVDLLKQRSQIFIKEAESVHLPIYPFKEGFFITIPIEDELLKEIYHQKLIENHIYTIQVDKGIRVALCSLTTKKVQGLAFRMKSILEESKVKEKEPDSI